MSKYKIICFIIPMLIIGSTFILLHEKNETVFDLIKHETLLIFGYYAAMIDVHSRLIPNKLILWMIAIWILNVMNYFLVDTEGAVIMIKDGLLGFLLGGGLFLLVYLISKKGLGGGDVKFIAASGLYLGSSSILPVILNGMLLATFLCVVMMFCKKMKVKDNVPLAPFLYMGILTVLLRIG